MRSFEVSCFRHYTYVASDLNILVYLQRHNGFCIERCSDPSVRHAVAQQLIWFSYVCYCLSSCHFGEFCIEKNVLYGSIVITIHKFSTKYNFSSRWMRKKEIYIYLIRARKVQFYSISTAFEFRSCTFK